MASNAIYQNEFDRQQHRKGAPKGHLCGHRWFLVHTNPQSLLPLPVLPEGTCIRHCAAPTVAFYRPLYHAVGENWLWGDRRRLSDHDLINAITAPDIEVHVLYERGSPAGYFELDLADPNRVDILYFGLLPDYTGRGLGKLMLAHAVAMAAGPTGSPVLLDTCSFDHPYALANYLQMGFRIDREADFFYRDPRLDGVIPKDAAPHIPLADE